MRGSPATQIRYKTCARCEKTKPTTEFYTRQASKDGLQRNCSECSKKLRSEQLEESRNGIKQSIINHVLHRHYRSDFNVMLENEKEYKKSRKQRKLCPKCNKPMRYRSILKTCEPCHQKMKGEG